MEESVLIGEIREDYQIPPYCPDSVLLRSVQQGLAFFASLNPHSTDPDNDKRLKSLLKAYVYYDYNHVLNEFRDNYGPDILSWQLESEVSEDESSNDESDSAGL